MPDMDRDKYRNENKRLKARIIELEEALGRLESINQGNQILIQKQKKISGTDKESAKELRETIYQYGERLKELNCFYTIANSVTRRHSIDEILQDTVNIIPPSWQYPDFTCARIFYGNKAFHSADFKETKWKQEALLFEGKKQVGKIQVFYKTEKPELDEGPFMKEERQLLEGIAGFTGQALQRIRTQDILNRQREQFFLALEASNDAIWDWDLVKNELFYSDKWWEQLGYKPGELEVNPDLWKSLLHPDEVEKVSDFLNGILNSDKTKYSREMRLRHKDGSYISVLSRGFIIRDKENQPLRITGTNMDLTKREQEKRQIQSLNQQLAASEQQLKAAVQQLEASEQQLLAANQQLRAYNQQLESSERRFRELFEGSRDGIVIVNNTGKIINANKAYCNLLGYTLEELKELDDFNDITPERWHEWERENIFNKLLEEKDYTGIFEKEYIRKEGEIIPVELQAYSYRDSEGNILFLWAVARDLRELQELQQEKRIDRLRLEEAEKLGKMGHVDWDVQKASAYWSDEIFRIYERDPSLGVPDYDEIMALHVSEDAAILEKSVLECIDKGIGYELDLRAKMQSGKLKYLHIIGNPLKDRDGKVINIRGIVQDITERKEFEQEILKAKEKAEESDHLKTAFLANVSHEIRTPMNGIMGFANILQKTDLNNESFHKYVDIIKQSGDRMLNTVNDIIDISRIDAGQVEVQCEKVYIQNELESVYNFFLAEINPGRINFQLENNQNLKDEFLFTDHSKLNSIITNLLKNAIKFTDRGTITFGCRKKDNGFEFFVRDTGIGIPLERQTAIFNRFEQADIQDKKAYQGSGLGLAIAKSYVEMLGGRIWFESELNSGTTFYFSIPEEDSNKKFESVDYITKKPQISMNLKQKIKILIAEDDEFSYEHFSIILEDIASDIIWAKSGTEAVELFRENKDIDLVLMDIKMPEMNGLDATRQIKQIDNRVTVIGQSAYAMAHDAKNAAEAGCDDYISKPIIKSNLMEKIQNFFE